MKRVILTALGFAFLLVSCHKQPVPTPGPTPSGPDVPTPVQPREPRNLELSFSSSMPNLRLSDGMTSIRTYWAEDASWRIYTDAPDSYVIGGNVSAGGRSASFSGTVQVCSDTLSFSGYYPSGENPSIPSLQKPRSSAPDPASDYLLLKPREAMLEGAAGYELTLPSFGRILSYICLVPGSSFSVFSNDILRFVEFTLDPQSEGALAGGFRISDQKAVPSGRPLRSITLSYKDAGIKLGECEIWATVFEGTHKFASITISTDKRTITLKNREISSAAGTGLKITEEIVSGDSVEDVDPAPVDNGKAVWYYKDRTLGGPACADNFLCPLNGHSYSPYTLRYLDPFTLLSSNPNGWSTSSSNKLAGNPLLSEEEYLSVRPYIIFYTATNTIYGPAAKDIVMQAYSYDAMLYVNQMGTPAIMFRRLGASGAASDENTTAQWVKEGKIDNISTASDGTVTIKNGSSTISRNFKVDKSTVQYSTSNDSRDYWKKGDVIMVQRLGRYGNVTDKQYFGSGFIYIKDISSSSYDSKTGSFRTMDHYSRLTVDCYWEK